MIAFGNAVRVTLDRLEATNTRFVWADTDVTSCCNYVAIMMRTQILLTREQHRELKRWAQQRNISLAEAVRRCVQERLAAEQAAPTRATMVREALSAAGAYRDPESATTIAREHDKHLVKAYRK